MSRFVDFKAVKAAVTMLQVLEHFGVAESFKRTGNSLSGPCPLHGGQNRTQFRVSLDKNCWNCFGTCKGGGNILDFVAKKEGCSLREAALKLCDWFQLPMQEKSPRPEKDEAETQKPDTPRKAERPPQASKPKKPDAEEDGPNKPLGFELQNLDPVHPYVAERGVSAETIAEFGIGHCNKGSMTGRIVVPIHNAEGQLVAYAGRWPGPLPDEDTPKYRLPPGFRKARELFNSHRAFAEPDTTPLFIVEGFFDCMRLWQHGIRRVVALMGSSLSPHQEELIRRHTHAESRVMLLLDEDDAGRAARDVIASLLARFVYVKAHVFRDEGQQPDALTPEQIAELLPSI